MATMSCMEVCSMEKTAESKAIPTQKIQTKKIVQTAVLAALEGR